ncbi:hypothetical protein [Pontibacter beigongshangensis]|uniref:hypothetical protein n=1 Tax=Pontibacter beigongshangensis TaxID=2574733 RepID=UPI001650A76C|nr:hypothetical protein [Pontibacter beigongshangensis]
MEKLIFGYCILLLLIIFLILGLLLWDAEKTAGKSGGVKENLLLGSACLMGFIIFHMNCLLLLWSADILENTIAVIRIVLLFCLCAVPAVYLLKNLFYSEGGKDKAEWDVFVSGK